MSDQLLTVPFDALVYNPAINARGDTESDVGELVAQIAARGLGQPLLVRPVGNTFEVTEGGRRMRAIATLIDLGHWDKTKPIPVLARAMTDAEAREASLMTNLSRLDLDVVDEVRAFTRLAQDDRLSVADIAAHFGIPERRVQQRLALGALHPPILDALKRRDIDIKTAQAFTLAKKPKQQAKLWKELGGAPQAWQVRQALTKAKRRADDPRVAFVGLDAYTAAGGGLIADLFGADAWLADAPRFEALFEAKLEAAPAATQADGWAWCEIDREGKKQYDQWPRLTPKGEPQLDDAAAARVAALEIALSDAEHRRAALGRLGTHDAAVDAASEARALRWELEELTRKPFTARQKKLAGVVIIATPTRFEIREGLQKPARGKPKPAIDDDPAEASPSPASSAGEGGDKPDEGPSPRPPDEPDFTGALLAELAHVMGGALQMAIAAQPGQATRLLAAALIAAVEYGGHVPPGQFALSPRAWSAPEIAAGHTQFRRLLDEALKPFQTLGRHARLPPAVILDKLDLMEEPDRARLLALLLANTLDWSMHADRALVRRLDPDIIRWWQPDEPFFRRLNRQQLIDALDEAQIAPPSRSAKKPDLVALALAELPPRGWLPQPLRTPSYAGPGSNAWAEGLAEVKAPPPADPIPQAAE